jgi:hypothetical protein
LTSGNEVVKTDDVLLLRNDVHIEDSSYTLLGPARANILVKRDVKTCCYLLGDTCGEVFYEVTSLRRGDDAPTAF